MYEIQERGDYLPSDVSSSFPTSHLLVRGIATRPPSRSRTRLATNHPHVRTSLGF